jgi:Carboxypeptidase regulatory-like domain
MVLSALTARAATVEVTVRDAAGCLDRAAVVRATNAEAAKPEVVDVPLAPPGPASIAAENGWLVGVVSKDCWSTTASLGPTDRTAAVVVYPRASAAGTFDLARGTKVEKLAATVFRRDSPTGGASLPAVEGDPTSCSVEDGTWRCDVPAGIAFDLRLDAHGAAPVYFWNVVARRETATTLPPAVLRAGASIAAWIQTPDATPAEKASVVLVPAGESNAATTQVRRNTATTNARGFVQFTGLAAGEYRLVSEKAPWSRAVVPVIVVRDGESVVYPRPVRHAPLASVNVTLAPATQSSGERWTVELNEAVPRGTDGTRMTRTVPVDGALTVDRVPAAMYRLVVKTADGSVADETVVDVTSGGNVNVALNLEEIAVRGKLLVGSEPLEAHIRFSSETGKAVRASAAEDGTFTARFPASGKWSTTVFVGATRSQRITAPPVEIPKERESAPFLEIHLPGGRLRGTVVNSSGTNVKAAVHAWRDNTIVAQQVTDSEGAFDLIGLKPGTYTVDAQAADGFAPATPIEVAKDETTEVTLTVEKYEYVTLLIRTPHGAPMSGASIEVSLDGGLLWTERVTSADGRARLRLPRGTAGVEVVVNTAAYPSRALHLPVNSSTLGREIDVVLAPAGGRLTVAGGGYLVTRDTRAPYVNFIRRGMQMGYGDGRAFLEPGTYHICPGPRLEQSCAQVSIAPGSSEFVDLRRKEKGTTP